jgi:3-methyladenine DNA glycosylase AlkD
LHDTGLPGLNRHHATSARTGVGCQERSFALPGAGVDVSDGGTDRDDRIVNTTPLAELRRALEASAVPEDAPPMAAYMRDQFPFLGVKTPARRRAARPLLRAVATWGEDDVVDLVDACWTEPEREFQYVASDVVAAESRRFGPERLIDLRRWITTSSWWDTVDALASNGVGTIVHSFPELASEMDVWIADENLWVRQLTYKNHTDEERLFRYVVAGADETNFFIRKANGWALREYGKTAPEAVRRFVAEHENSLCAPTRREALRNL